MSRGEDLPSLPFDLRYTDPLARRLDPDALIRAGTRRRRRRRVAAGAGVLALVTTVGVLAALRPVPQDVPAQPAPGDTRPVPEECRSYEAPARRLLLHRSGPVSIELSLFGPGEFPPCYSLEIDRGERSAVLPPTGQPQKGPERRSYWAGPLVPAGSPLRRVGPTVFARPLAIPTGINVAPGKRLCALVSVVKTDVDTPPVIRLGSLPATTGDRVLPLTGRPHLFAHVAPVAVDADQAGPLGFSLTLDGRPPQEWSLPGGCVAANQAVPIRSASTHELARTEAPDHHRDAVSVSRRPAVNG